MTMGRYLVAAGGVVNTAVSASKRLAVWMARACAVDFSLPLYLRRVQPGMLADK